MFDIEKIKKYFEGEDKDKLDNVKDDISLAAGVILLEVAYSDKDFADEEKDLIIDVFKKEFNMSEEESNELIEIGTRIINEDTNRWRYANIINENYSNEQKYKLIRMVWELIYADNKLDKYEDQLIHRLSKVLHVPHNKLIEAKVEVLEGKK
ncbi:TerB family tellurite resistance protein [Elusimicrobiota bacterium]